MFVRGKSELLRLHSPAVFEEQGLPVGVERREIVVALHLVATDDDAIGALGVYQRGIERLKHIVFDADGAGRSTVETGGGSIGVGYFRIDGNNGARELEKVGEGVDEAVPANREMAHGSALIPSVAVAAEQDGSAGGMVEEIVFAHRRPWR